MSESRQIGLWLVAGYFFAKSALITVNVATAFFEPSETHTALATIREIIPLVRRLDPGPDFSLTIGLAFVLFGIVVGVCVLRHQKWAAGYIVAYHGIALLWFLVASLGLRAIGFDSSPPMLTSSYGNAEMLASLFMVVYLLQPNVRRSFGFS
jgi:uncharacterized protein YybS (DUF2232 family)